MLKIFIGPNGYGKTYELEQRKQELLNENKERKFHFVIAEMGRKG